MKKVFQKAFVLVIVILMLLSVTGCGTANQQADNSTSTAISSTTGTPDQTVDWANAPVVKVMIRDTTSAPRTASKLDPDDNPYSRYIFDKTGVKLVLDREAASDEQYSQKVYLSLASGNAADMIFLGGNDALCMDIARSGALTPLNQYLDKYPNLQNLYNDQYWSDYSFDSNKYVIKGVDVYPVARRATLIRQDWLDKLNLQMPNTVSGLEDTLKAFIAAKPDGQKVDGLTGRGNFSYFYTLSSAYGCPNYDLQMGFWYVDKAEQKLTFWNTTDAARAYFAEAAKFYKEGLIDPELITDSGANFWSKINNGNVGIVSYLADGAAWVTTMVRQAQKVTTPNYVVMDALTGTGFKDPTGVEGALESNYLYEGYYAVPRENKNVENVLKVMDFEASADFLDFKLFGLEGIEHDVFNGKEVVNTNRSSKVSFINDYIYTCNPDLLTNDQKLQTINNMAGGGDADLDPIDQCIPRLQAALDKCAAQSVLPQMFAATIPDLPEVSQFPDVQSNYIVLYVKMITGELDASKDAEWQAYLKNCEDIGIDTITKAKSDYLLKNKPELFK